MIAAVALVLGGSRTGLCGVTAAHTWIETVQDKLFCLSLASDAERAELSLPLSGRSREDLTAYWERVPPDAAGRWVRYVISLEMLAYFADRSDDQRLHTDLLIEIGVLAGRDQLAPQALRAQIERCALAQISAAAVERDDVRTQREVVKLLALQYQTAPGRAASEDLPLIHGLRALALSPEPEATPLLTEAALKRAEALAAAQPLRASRLLAEVAPVVLAAGDRGRAWALTQRSFALAGDIRRLPPRAAWQNFPAQYDAVKGEQGQAAANKLAWAMAAMIPLPPVEAGALGDPELEHAVTLRLAEAATAQHRYDEGKVWWDRARAAITDARRGLTSMPFYRRGLADTTAQSQKDEHAAQLYAWGHDLGSARRDYLQTFRPLVARTRSLAQSVPLADARAQLLLVDQADRRTDVLSILSEVLPEQRADIADMSFRLSQLRGFDRMAPAAVFQLLHRQGLDPTLQRDLERVLNYQVMPSMGLRNLWAQMHAAVASAPEQTAITHDVWLTLNVFYNETGPALAGYLATVSRANPQLGALLNPTAWPASSFQGLLRDDEAMVVVESTGQGVFVWAFTRREAVFERSDLGPAAVQALVERVRRSLLPRQGPSCIEVPPFDAAAAYELYRHTLGKVRAHLRDGMHLFWTSNGALAAVPPALLIDRPPPRDLIAAAPELRGLGWMVDRFSISVLPAPALLILKRATVSQPAKRKYAFLGVGAPRPAVERLLGVQRVPAVGGRANPAASLLGQLPPLPASEEELVKLSRLFGPERSKLLLGAAASKPAVLRELAEGAQVVDFATHGFTAGEIERVSDPALLLSIPTPLGEPLDALLTARDVAGTHLDADLMILSACNTASSDGRPRGETFSGLATSFAHSGANALLVSHWEVASGAATALSVNTVDRARREGRGLADSLRTAMRALRDEPALQCPDLHAHPFYWAPFVLVGDGARGLP